jgi:hypothetical protein
MKLVELITQEEFVDEIFAKLMLKHKTEENKNLIVEAYKKCVDFEISIDGSYYKINNITYHCSIDSLYFIKLKIITICYKIVNQQETKTEKNG